MSKTTVWVRLDNGRSNPTKVKLNPDDDLDDLCHQLKIRMSTELKDIGETQLDVKLSRDEPCIRRDKKIKELPLTSASEPLILDVTGNKSPADSILNTPSNQFPTSTISNDANDAPSLKGFGWLPSSFRVDATDGFFVSSTLCPSDDEVFNVSEDMPLAGELMEMIPRGETDSKGINIIIGATNALCGSVANGTSTLHAFDLDIGLASRASECDHLLLGDGKIPCGVIELKAGQYSSLFGNRQAAAYGTHIAVGLLKQGIPREQIIVPSYTFNGTQIQFGATIVLYPSFPVYWTISKLLDMADAGDRRLAVAYIQKTNAWVKRLSSYPRTPPLVPVIGMKLDVSLYYKKTLTEAVTRRGFQLFSNFNDDISQGMEHWGRVLNLLSADPEVRPHVAFPLAIRSPNSSDDERDYIIIYKDLCREGYRIGCPHRVKEAKLYDAFLIEYRRIMKLVHRAGVIHCDLYPSNVMWRRRQLCTGSSYADDLVDIIIIDWDCSHCLIEGRFNRRVEEALRGHKPNRDAEFGVSFDDRYIDVLDREYVASEDGYWADLASGIKENIDAAFYSLFTIIHTNDVILKTKNTSTAAMAAGSTAPLV